jgi:hypothetical protein
LMTNQVLWVICLLFLLWFSREAWGQFWAGTYSYTRQKKLRDMVSMLMRCRSD